MSGASEFAYNEIRDRLLSGKHPPGSQLNESELSEICGVSRTPVREALRRLALDYFVRLEPNRGAFVIDWSREDIMDMFEMRSMMEGLAARKAAERASPDQIAKMSSIIDRSEGIFSEEGVKLRDKFLALNREFHDAILEASGSLKLTEIVSRFVEQAVIDRTAANYTVADVAHSNRQHKELYSAIASGNGLLAEAVMRSHILAASSRYHDNYMLAAPAIDAAAE